jgi:hypothetical protein
VAFGASLRESQVGIFPAAQFRVIDEVWTMACPAVCALMRTREFIPRQAVVKGIFIKSDQIKIATMVLAVAICAFLLTYRGRCVVPLFLTDPYCNFFMAGQALFVRDFFAQGMALRTIGDPFQIGMRLGQGSGRKLCLKTG